MNGLAMRLHVVTTQFISSVQLNVPILVLTADTATLERHSETFIAAYNSCTFSFRNAFYRQSHR